MVAIFKATRRILTTELGEAANKKGVVLGPRRVTPLLYVYRVLLTGIHLMRTGEVEANLVTLNEEFQLPQVPDLVARKLAGPEQGSLPDDDFEFHQSEYHRLEQMLTAAGAASELPNDPSGAEALNDLLVRVRLSMGVDLPG